MSVVHILYFSDTLCIWTYAAQTRIDAVKEKFGDASILRRAKPTAPATHEYFVIIDRALRDEGTSYHYAAPSEFAEADTRIIATASKALSALKPRGVVGSSWTTEAPFRETAEAIKPLRFREGSGSAGSLSCQCNTTCGGRVTILKKATPTGPTTRLHYWIRSSALFVRKHLIYGPKGRGFGPLV